METFSATPKKAGARTFDGALESKATQQTMSYLTGSMAQDVSTRGVSQVSRVNSSAAASKTKTGQNDVGQANAQPKVSAVPASNAPLLSGIYNWLKSLESRYNNVTNRLNGSGANSDPAKAPAVTIKAPA